MNQHPGERDADGFDAVGRDAVSAPAPKDSPGVAADDTADVAPDAASAVDDSAGRSAADAVDDGARHNRAGAAPDAADAVDDGAGHNRAGAAPDAADAVDDGAGHNRAGAAPDAADAVDDGADADSPAAAPEGAVGAPAGDECGEAWGYPGDAAEALAEVAGAVRGEGVRAGLAQAKQLRHLAELATLAEATARRVLAATPRVSGQPDDLSVIDAAVSGEVQAALGGSAFRAGWMLELARRLTGVLTDTLTALEEGRLDLYGARVLSEATTVCTDTVARQVEATVLPAAGQGLWEVPGPRAWRVRVERAVVKADADAAQRRRVRAVAERELRTWPDRDGTGVLWMRAALEDITLAEQVVSGLAHAGPTHDQQGRKLAMDQRRVEVMIDLLRRVHDGQPLPQLGGRRGREVGVVLHADTLFGHGPAAGDPGELRGLGTPAPIDPVTAREMAEAQIVDGAPTCVFLTDTHGALQRLVRLMLGPGQSGWTRETLTAAVQAALPDLAPLGTDRYPPTAAIVEHVHARNPHCTAYDCPRVARRCDIDHDRPWPRGPTEVTNLQPRCRRHHELKTRGLVQTRLHPDGTVMTRMLTGLIVTTAPEPLPGHAPGEGYHQR